MSWCYWRRRIRILQRIRMRHLHEHHMTRAVSNVLWGFWRCQLSYRVKDRTLFLIGWGSYALATKTFLTIYCFCSSTLHMIQFSPFGLIIVDVAMSSAYRLSHHLDAIHSIAYTIGYVHKLEMGSWSTSLKSLHKKVLVIIKTMAVQICDVHVTVT